MIWTPYAALVAIDLTIVGMAVVMLSIATSRGMFRKGETPRAGRLLITASVMVTSLYYLADFLALAVIDSWFSRDASLAAIDFLQEHVRTPATLLSFGLIVSGAIVVAIQRGAVEENIRLTRNRMEQAEATIIESENRFRVLIEQYSDAVYCFEFRPAIDVSIPAARQIDMSLDAVLVECNNEFARSIGSRRTSQVIGRRLRDLDISQDREGYSRFFGAFIESGYLLNGYERTYETGAGVQRAQSIGLRGIVKNGRLVAAWGAEVSVLDRKITEAALRGRERFQEIIARVSGRLLTSPSSQIDGEIKTSLRDTCRFMGANRVTLLWLDETAGVVDLLYFFSEHEAPPSDRVPLEAFPYVVSRVYTGEVVSFSSVEALPDDAAIDKEQLKAMGIHAAMVAPLVVEGRTLGACSVTADERTWSAQEERDLQVMAELFANAISRLKSRRRLDQALAELKDAKERLEAENVYLQQEVASSHGFGELVGESDSLKRSLLQVAQVAKTRAPVLILGETGTGKELLARALHERSDRSDRPLVKVNCAALPANLIESELFGHEKGAFTGALKRKLGRFELADGGTLFLDEIGDFPLDLQGKLLRALQDGEIQRVGATETTTVDVRIIAATNRRLIDAVSDDEFRADLYYRINTFTIESPPLRERRGDIALLAQHFVSVYAPQFGKVITSISRSMLDQLEAYSWPGNVRELESVIQRTLIVGTDSVLRLEEPLGGDVEPMTSYPALGAFEASPTDLRSAEKAHILAVLDNVSWKISGADGAADQLGLPPSTLRSRMKKLGIARLN